MLEGMRVQERWKISYWDSLVIAAAQKTKAKIIWSENLNAGQDYEGITVVNPLKK